MILNCSLKLSNSHVTNMSQRDQRGISVCGPSPDSPATNFVPFFKNESNSLNSRHFVLSLKTLAYISLSR